MVQLDRAFIEKEMRYWKIPGAAIVLLQEGAEDEILCLGERDIEKELRVDENTLFCIASCSKSMTSFLIARLVDEGILDYDRPLREYIPWFRMMDPEASEKMCLRDMLCHRTGLPAHDALWPGENTRENLMRSLQYLEPNCTFREKAQYNNLVYALAGYVAEYVTGKNWDTLMQEYVFAPLGMKTACCYAEDMLKSTNHAEPYQYIKGEMTHLPFWNVDLAGPAASVNASIKDMAAWLHYHIDRKLPDGTTLVSEKNFLQMHTKQIDYEDNSDLPPDCYPCNSYCMGWLSGKYRDISIQRHSGKIEGYSTLQVYSPDLKAGMVMMLNLHSPSSPFFYSVLYHTLDQLLGIQDTKWETKLREDNDEPAIEAYEDLNVDLVTERYRNLTEEVRQGVDTTLVGTYWNNGYGKVEITCAEDRLFLAYRDQNLELKHKRDDFYWMDDVKEDILTMRIPVSVQRIEDGAVQSVSICYEPCVADIVFVSTKEK